FDLALEDVREQLLDVRADRGRSAADGDVVVERRFRAGDRLVVGDTHAPHGATRTGDADRGAHGLVGADALDDGVDAEAAGQRAHARDGLLATLAHDVRCAELLRQGNPVGMAAHHDNLLGAEAARGDDGADLQGADARADRLDVADRLVAHAAGGLARLHQLVRPEIAAADAGTADGDERVGRLDQAGVGDVLDADVAGAVQDGCAHRDLPLRIHIVYPGFLYSFAE